MFKLKSLKQMFISLVLFTSISYAAGWESGDVYKVRSFFIESEGKSYVNIQYYNGNNYYFEVKGRPVEDMWLSQILLAQSKPTSIEFYINST